MDRENVSFWAGCFFGGLAGIAVGAGVVDAFSNSRIEEARIFPRGDQPAVIRIYNGGTDQILIESKKSADGKSNYMPLETYLSQIQPYSNRIEEEKKIKDLVGGNL
ncbi:MAG: hypothetical protein AABW48_05375 [Nanoarchaeota archaeon]